MAIYRNWGDSISLNMFCIQKLVPKAFHEFDASTAIGFLMIWNSQVFLAQVQQTKFDELPSPAPSSKRRTCRPWFETFRPRFCQTRNDTNRISTWDFRISMGF